MNTYLIEVYNKKTGTKLQYETLTIKHILTEEDEQSIINNLKALYTREDTFSVSIIQLVPICQVDI